MTMLIVSKDMISRESFKEYREKYERRKGIKLNRTNIKKVSSFSVCNILDVDKREMYGFSCGGVSCDECSDILFEKYPGILNDLLKESNVGILK